MSIRALVIGALLALLLAVGGHFNDAYMGQTSMVGNHFPVSVMGVLVLLVLLVNPVLHWIRPQLQFRAAELGVMVALPFAVCVVPGMGFLRAFTQVLTLPMHYEKAMHSWQENQLLSYVPPSLLPNGGADSEEVVGGYLRGMGAEGGHIGLGKIPWRAWRAPLLNWIPLFLALMIGLIGLSLVLHRQWVSHEHLVYPVARFVQLLSGGSAPARGEGTEGAAGPADGAHAQPPVLRSRLFWWGLAPVLCVRLINGLQAWFPRFDPIPHAVNLRPLRELFPLLASTPGSNELFYSTVYFSVVAFAYFLPSDISFSLGMAGIFCGLFSAAFLVAGVTIGGSYLGAWDHSAPGVGAYLALAILIVYNGRAYYGRVLRAAVAAWRPAPDPEPSAVWGMRLFVLMTALAVVMMVHMGVALPFALLLTALLIVTYTVMSRVCAETGLFFMQSNWYASGVLLGVFGATAIGPQILVVMTLITVILCRNPRECMMPFIVNALRIAEDTGVRKGRLALIMGGVLVAGLAAGLTVVLWLQYDRGVSFADGYATNWVPKSTFFLMDTHVQELKADGALEQSLELSDWARLAAIRPNGRYVGFLLAGFGLFTLCALIRRRFSRWPLHPVIFLVAFTSPGRLFAASFLIGWLIKAAIVRFGGGGVYRRGVPLMVGVIAGDLIGGLVFMIAGAVYYFMTGFEPVRYWIFPQ
ncbi:MAG: hypothetical protein JXR37_34250 [Kiritimatiellae bacterium]|nr:hypothetical protein [Kiritimatiellia bacterium]